jgi:cytochrome c553
VHHRALNRGARVALLSLVIVACTDRSNGSIQEPPPPTTGVITGAVSWGSVMVQGVSVSLTSGRTTTTGANGVYSFTDVAAGAYNLSIAVPDGFELPVGEPASKSVVVTAGQTATVNFSVVEAAMDLSEGERLFDHETFGGNGRTCATCHMEATGTITLQAIAARLLASPNDPLFRHDATDNGTSGTVRITTHGTIRVEVELPPHITLVGNPGQRTIVLNRGVPSTMNSPAFDGRGLTALMYDLRLSTLQEQAAAAIRDHAQFTSDPTSDQIEAIVAFQQRSDRFFTSEAVRTAANGGVSPGLPDALTASQTRGRTFFENVPPAGDGKAGSCALCHSGPNLNEVNQFGQANVGLAPGAKFGNVRVAERNATQNPLLTFRVENAGGVARTVTIADPGIMLTGRSSAQVSAFFPANLHVADLAGFFKTPTLWGVRHTPPYFHDNSAKTLRDVVDHYADFFFPEVGIFLTEQDREDIVAFLERF